MKTFVKYLSCGFLIKVLRNKIERVKRPPNIHRYRILAVDDMVSCEEHRDLHEICPRQNHAVGG